MLNQPPQPYATAIIKLLKGVVYYNDSCWNDIQNYLSYIREYFAKIGVELHYYESDGFAYLTQPRTIEIDNQQYSLPRLTTSHKLNLKTTIFCLLLRIELQKFDASTQTGKPTISIEKIRDLLLPYFGEINDEEMFRKEVDKLVNRAIKELGILRELSEQDQEYEIYRIIKAKINTETLEELKEKLQKYVTSSIPTPES